MSAQEISNAILKVVACSNGFIDKQEAEAREGAGIFTINPLYCPSGFPELVKAVREYRKLIEEGRHATT
jgi:hypothetical protein